MSWQVGILIGLTVMLVAGFFWYERSRPPSQVVAAVAALAALAVAGRLALAPVPNVVATTDIVLITGYAIGAAPGFAVGALAAVVSNFWLGQGPWTPWQMAGWGMAGVLGAALAAASNRRLGRLGLAAACGVAGLLYGALLDLSVMVTYGGEQSLDRYLALSARGVPFNVAHALGNVALALAAGPALVRILIRYRQRFEVRWRETTVEATPRNRTAPGAATGVVAALAALACLLGGAAAGLQQASGASSNTNSALRWLLEARNKNGGFGAEPGQSSDPAMTGWAVLGVEAAGHNPLDAGGGGRSPIAYLRRNVEDLTTTGDLERTILALEGAGLNARGFGGRNLVVKLRNRRRDDGSFQGQVNLTAFGILALEAAGAPGGNPKSGRWLRRARNGDGGWGFVPDAASDPDSTGAALQAIAASGGGKALNAGAAYLRRAQKRGGGFAIRGGTVNSQSTAWAVQGLIAAGVKPITVKRGGKSPFDYFARRQRSDGHFSYSRTSDQTPVWVTAQVLLAIAREPFPLEAVPRRSRPRSRRAAGGAPSAVGGFGGGGVGVVGGGGVVGTGGGAAGPRPRSILGGVLGGPGRGAGGKQAPGVAARPGAEITPGALPGGPVSPTEEGETPEPASAESEGGGDFPIWLALVLVAAVAGLLIGAQRYQARTR